MRGSRPTFDTRAGKRRNWRYTFRRWDYQQKRWIPLAYFASLDWRVLDRMAGERAEFEIQLVEGETLVSEWTEGKRMPTLKGAMAT